MRKVSILIAICFVFAVGFSLRAQDAAPLKPIMTQVNTLWTGLDAKIAAGDTAGVGADLGKLDALFVDAESFFTKTKMTEPAGWAKEQAGIFAEAKTKAGTIDKAAKGTLGKCKQCHTVYRGGDATAGFTIKQKQ